MNTSLTDEIPKSHFFSDLGCEEILYRIIISDDKFDYKGFTESVDKKPPSKEWGSVCCPSDANDYHAHISWMKDKSNIRIQIDFDPSPPEDTTKEGVPVRAEECLGKLGRFFKNEDTQAHVHVDFKFADRQSRFPLPLRTTIGSCKTDIDGIGLRLVDIKAGVSQVWLVNRKDNSLSVQMTADRKVVFGTFSLEQDLRELKSVADMLTEVKQ